MAIEKCFPVLIEFLPRYVSSLLIFSHLRTSVVFQLQQCLQTLVRHLEFRQFALLPDDDVRRPCIS